MPSKPVKCWDVFECNQPQCPAYQSEDWRCWLFPGASCEAGAQATVDEKLEQCLSCQVLAANIDPEAMTATCQLMLNSFREYSASPEIRDTNARNNSLEMAIGLSEVFNALEKLSKGDPSVRIPETSDTALLRKLKQLVNATAENLGEIVDLSHDFAIGLSEHFDVLRRASAGDLAARVRGDSQVELLESLKILTNRMIDSVEREIAERAQSEADLRESENRFRTFVEKAPIGIVIMRPDMTYAYINPTFTELTGYTLADVPDKFTWFKKAYPEEAFRVKVVGFWKTDCRNAIQLGSSDARTLTARCKDGREKVVSVRMVVLPNGDHFITYSDITEKARAREAIKQSEEKYRTLIDNIQDGVFISQDNVLQFANGALARMIGYSPQEMIGESVRKFIAPEDWAEVNHRGRSRMRSEAVEREYEFRLLHKDGLTRVIVNMQVDMFTYRDKPATIGTIKNITEQKRTAQEKKKLEARLQRSQKMEAIGTLAGGVAHDLNNILSGIVSYPELILMDLPDDSPLRKPILTMQRSGEKATAIVQDLLTLARRAVSSLEVVNPNEIITDFLKSPEFNHLRAFHSDLRIETDLAPDLFNIKGSPVHLSKSVMNLISNAAEAMPEGGVIRLATANRYIDRPIRGYDAVAEGDYVTLTVADSGVGISRENLDRIFEPFYTKKVMGRSGTGLGMAVVWGTVKDHNGYIDVLSTEERGTTFTLYFPVTREKQRGDAGRLSFEDYKGQGESILVVDDVAEQREIAAAMLSKLGYTVAVSASGEEAIAYLENRGVDLVVLDMIMEPGIDGLETYRRMIKLHPGQKAVIASGFSLSNRVKEIQKLGAGVYVKKPYTMEKIAMAVRSVLER